MLVAVGRPPNLKGLDLDASGLALDDHGTPVFDRTTMQCADAPVFMAGDANADVPLLHEASTGVPSPEPMPRPIRRSRRKSAAPAFALTFTDPPLASVGTGPGDGVIRGRSDYSDQGRARTEARAEGAVTLYCRCPRALSGADLCCPGGDHLGASSGMVCSVGRHGDGVLTMPSIHPTLEEAEAALRQICGKTRQAEPAGRDFGTPPAHRTQS